MENFSFEFLFLLALIAFLYSSVGHGGASGYLALMAFFNFNPTEMRPSALMLNIFVSGIAFFQYYRSGNFRWKIFFPFAILSIPLAFAGSRINIGIDLYKLILGICLIFAAFRMMFILGKKNEDREMHYIPAIIIGGLIGFISGVIGIGGGILLSPLLLFLGWANMKETAAISSLFILVNSVSGFTGLISQGAEFSSQIFIWTAVAGAGGLAGSYFGSRLVSMAFLRYVLSAVLIFAGIKLIIF